MWLKLCALRERPEWSCAISAAGLDQMYFLCCAALGQLPCEAGTVALARAATLSGPVPSAGSHKRCTDHRGDRRAVLNCEYEAAMAVLHEA